MQLIEPKIPIRIRPITLLHTHRLVHIAVVFIPEDRLAALHHARAIKVLRRVHVHISHEAVGIEHREVRARIAVRDLDFIRRLVFEDIVHARRVLTHRVCDVGVVIGFHGPVLIFAHAVEGIVRVQRRKVQWCGVHQHEVPGALLVEAVEYVVYARSIIRKDFTRDLAIGEEGPDAKVVGADPEGVDCVHGVGFGAV